MSDKRHKCAHNPLTLESAAGGNDSARSRMSAGGGYFPVNLWSRGCRNAKAIDLEVFGVEKHLCRSTAGRQNVGQVFRMCQATCMSDTKQGANEVSTHGCGSAGIEVTLHPHAYIDSTDTVL